MMPIGTMVHYVLPDGPERVHGQCRPAVVVRPERPEAASLVVFRNGPTDGAEKPLVEWVARASHSPQHEFGTWHTVAECREQA